MTIMLSPSSRRGAGLALGLALSLFVFPALAQDDGPTPTRERSGASQNGDSVRNDSARGDSARGDSKGDSDGAGRRLSRLEEQLVDIQVALGTLESLVKTGAPPAARDSGGSISGADPDSRLRALETQVSALTAQVEQLSQTLSSGAGGGRSGGYQDDGWAPQRQNYSPSTGSGGKRPAWRADDETDAQQDARRHDEPSGAERASRFGGTDTSAVAAGDRKSRFGEAGAGPSGDAPFSFGESPYAGNSAGGQKSVVATASSDAKSLYEEAYDNMIKRDYGEAESGFRQLLASYPGDSLAGNAQYWLGETYYAQGQYKESAAAFLKGYRDRPKGQKAPDSLLRLGMSLAKLGQKDAACATLGELKTKYPKASDGLKERAETEKKRSSC